jgi:hypothetical protein
LLRHVSLFIGTDRRIAASSEPGQLTEGHQKRPVPYLVLAATAGSDPDRRRRRQDRGGDLPGVEDRRPVHDRAHVGTLARHSQLLPALTDRLLAKKVTVTARPVEDDQSYVISWIAKPKRVIINKGWYNVPLGGA